MLESNRPMSIRTRARLLLGLLLLIVAAGLYAIAQVSVASALALLLAVAALAAAVWQLLDRHLLGRLDKISGDIERLGAGGDFHATSPLGAPDEVNRLEQAVDGALGSLAHSHALLKATFETTDAGFLTVDALGHTVSVNRRFLELWGVSQADLASSGEGAFPLLAARTAQPEAALARFRDWLSKPTESGREEFEMLSGNTLECTTRPQRVAGEAQAAGHSWDCRDITARKQAQATVGRQIGELISVRDIALAGAEATTEEELVELASKIVGANLYPADIFNIGLVDLTTGALQVLSSHYVRGEIALHTVLQPGQGITGRAVVTGQTQIVPDVRKESAYVEINAETRSEICVPMRVGQRVIGFLNVESAKPAAFGEADERLLTILAGQIATALEKVRMAAEVQRLAITDALTGLFNRRHFFATAQRELERARRHERPLSVIMLDLDHFKHVNDTYGHAAGDQTLKAVADYCSSHLRGTDVLGRYGGEEFVVLLPETTGPAACEAAERLRRGIEALAVPIAARTVKVTASLGVAALDPTHPTLDNLLDCADQALYEAKSAGRNEIRVWADNSGAKAQTPGG
jgi:diguanylate cyclase (GGDEF)-like protein/PAS domain S-box-containing protein